MILAPKIFLDQCIARPIAARCLEYYQDHHPSLKIRHLSDEYRANRCDSKWLPDLGKEGGWIVITKDTGNHSRDKKPRLPDLCIQHSVTCVAFSGKLCGAKAHHHQEGIDEVMRNLEPIYRAPAGTIIKLGWCNRPGGLRHFALRVRGASLGSFLESIS